MLLQRNKKNGQNVNQCQSSRLLSKIQINVRAYDSKYTNKMKGGEHIIHPETLNPWQLLHPVPPQGPIHQDYMMSFWLSLLPPSRIFKSFLFFLKHCHFIHFSSFCLWKLIHWNSFPFCTGCISHMTRKTNTFLPWSLLMIISPGDIIYAFIPVVF